MKILRALAILIFAALPCAVSATTPAQLQTQINSLPFTNGQGQLTGADLMALWNTEVQIWNSYPLPISSLGLDVALLLGVAPTGTGSLVGSISPTISGATLSGGVNIPGVATIEVLTSNTSPINTLGYSTIQAAINQANANGGGFVNVPAGTSDVITTSIDLLRGVGLEGSCPTVVTDVTLNCSRIRAGANIAALLTQSNNSNNPQHSMSVDGMSLDGNATNGYSVAAIVNWEPLNGHFTRNYVTNGSGDGVDHFTTTNPAWIDWYRENVIGGNVGIGLNILNGSDSRAVENDLEGNGVGIKIVSTGAWVVAFNEPSVSATDGIELSNSTNGVFHDSAIIGNIMNLNVQSDIHLMAVGGADSMQSTFVGNVHHVGCGYLIDANVTDASVIGDAFGYTVCPQGNLLASNTLIQRWQYRIAFVGTTNFIELGASANTVGTTFTANATGTGTGTGTVQQSADFTFSGSSNTGFGIFGTSHTLPSDERFINLPPDAQVISGGDGGPFNRLQWLILADPNAAPTVADAVLNVYGSHTVNTQVGVAARFGSARSLAGFDPAILIGAGAGGGTTSNGTQPFLGCFSGETSNLGGCNFYYQGTHGGGVTAAWSLTAAGMQIAGELTTPGLPTSAGSGGLYDCVDTSGNHYRKSSCP